MIPAKNINNIGLCITHDLNNRTMLFDSVLNFELVNFSFMMAWYFRWNIIRHITVLVYRDMTVSIGHDDTVVI